MSLMDEALRASGQSLDSNLEQEMREATSPLGLFFHTPARWRWWTVKTRAGEWRYRYCSTKNKAGYYLGDIVFIASVNGELTKQRSEGLFSRRVKQRVIDIQRARATKHRERIKNGG